jgi:hypothetical protein
MGVGVLRGPDLTWQLWGVGGLALRDSFLLCVKLTRRNCETSHSSAQNYGGIVVAHGLPTEQMSSHRVRLARTEDSVEHVAPGRSESWAGWPGRPLPKMSVSLYRASKVGQQAFSRIELAIVIGCLGLLIVFLLVPAIKKFLK